MDTDPEGAGWQLRCPACDRENPPATFECEDCGADLAEAELPSEAFVPEPIVRPNATRGRRVYRFPVVPKPRLCFELAVVLLLFVVPSILWRFTSESDNPPRVSTLGTDSMAILWEASHIALLTYLVWCGGRTREILGVARLPSALVLLSGPALGLLTMAIVVVCSSIDEPLPSDSLPPEPTTWLHPMLLFAAVVGEELLFRAYLWTRLVQLTRKPFLSMVLTSMLFAVVHPYGLGELTGIFLGGMLYSYLFLFRRSIYTIVVGHFVYNMLVSYGP